MVDVARLGLARLEVGAIELLALVRVAGPSQGEGGRVLHADDAVSRNFSFKERNKTKFASYMLGLTKFAVCHATSGLRSTGLHLAR